MKSVVAGLVLICAAGCSSDSKSDSSPKELEVFPPQLFSGFDGMHTYKAPAIAVNKSGAVTWTIADASIASLAPADDGEHVTITSLKAGETTITATSGAQKSTVPLKVYSYTTQQWDAGHTRYTTAADANNPECIACHSKNAGPDHTPTEVDADPDTEIQNTFLTGVDPEGRPIKDNSEFAYLLQGKNHTWKVTDAEKSGLVAYMRSLEPSGWPEYDAPTAGK
ncbi:MAG TPA: Ig-like domain-containing protein [Polyangiaceae bacterium]|nr:Ig-like domain-containing protein [Polyangiaceae bacterium]